MGKRSNRYDREADALFIGWKETPGGTHLPHFTIVTTEHPFYGFTVSEPVLHKLDLQVPRIPLRESNENAK